jgi:hypothetical protein
MHILAILAALVNGPPGEHPVAGSAAVAHRPPASPSELEAAWAWFVSEVADPVLAARDGSALRRLLFERSKVAVEARTAIAMAAARWFQTADGSVLEAAIRDRFAQTSPRLARLLTISLSDASGFFAALRERPPSTAEMTEAMRILTPAATDADVLLTLAALAATRPGVPTDVTAALVQLAEVSVLRHRSKLHAMLRRWNPKWEATIAAPAWADDPAALDLEPAEIEVVAQVFRQPPVPTPALRRALARR